MIAAEKRSNLQPPPEIKFNSKPATTRKFQKLPWASKLELFISDPSPVFAVLEILKEDEVRFVQRSVANNVADYLKVNFAAAKELLVRWQRSQNKNTQQIIRHATRKIKI